MKAAKGWTSAVIIGRVESPLLVQSVPYNINSEKVFLTKQSFQ